MVSGDFLLRRVIERPKEKFHAASQVVGPSSAIGVLLAALLSSGSAEAGERTQIAQAQAARQPIVFACPGGVQLRVECAVADPGQPVIVHSPQGPAITLPAQLSGSGFRYGDDQHELQGKGREVTWTDRNQPPLTCTEQGSKSGK